MVPAIDSSLVVWSHSTLVHIIAVLWFVHIGAVSSGSKWLPRHLCCSCEETWGLRVGRHVAEGEVHVSSMCIMCSPCAVWRAHCIKAWVQQNREQIWTWFCCCCVEFCDPIVNHWWLLWTTHLSMLTLRLWVPSYTLK